MTRPQASDVDAYLGGAVRDAPELVGPSERLKRALDAESFEQAGHELDTIESVATAAGVEKRALTRGLKQLRDALARMPTGARRRGGASSRSAPARRRTSCSRSSCSGSCSGRQGEGDDEVDTVFPDRPAHTVGLQPGDRIVAINGIPMTPSRITATISGSNGKPLTLLVSRGNQTVVLGPMRPKLDEGVYRLGFQLGAVPLGPGESVWESLVAHRPPDEGDRPLARQLRPRQGRKQLSSPIGIVNGSHKAAERGGSSTSQCSG